ncbi:baeRF2 domain-containing protein [Saccharothrix hoggarensis]
MHTASLHNLVDVEGPFVSVFLDVGDHVDLRWRAMRDQLQAQNADAYLMALAHKAIASGVTPRGFAGRALIVGDGRVLVDQYVPVPPSGYTARFGRLPYLLPLVDLSEPLLPHVVVQVAEHGADLRGVDPSGRPVAVASVGARRPGRRLDAAELADVAEEATTLVDRLGASLLVLAGPVAGRRSLRVALPNKYHHLVVEVEGPADRAVLHLAGRANQDARRVVVDRFRDESSRLTGRAVHGLDPVVRALEAGDVETLLVTDTLVGSREVDGGRADEVLPLRAVAAGAEIVLVGGAVRLHQDVGALLRS